MGYITGQPVAGTLTGDEALLISQLSSTVTISAATISATASDNSFNDSGSGFVAAGFAVGDRVNVSGFTGDTANNIYAGVLTSVAAGKIIVGGADGDVIVDDAAGETVTITKWESLRATAQEIADLAGAGTSPVGPHQIYIPAGAMKTRTTNGAAAGSTETTTNKIMVDSLDFDQSTQEYAQFSLRMPKSWDEGTVTMVFVWTATATGNVIWGGQGVAISNDDVIDAAFGTAQEVTDAVTAANDLMESAATSAITIGGTPAEGDWVVFQVYRKAADGGDTVAADAKLLGVVVTMTTNAATDA